MPPGHLPLEIFQAHPTGRRPWGRPRTRSRDLISLLAWECLGILLKELDSVAGERNVCLGTVAFSAVNIIQNLMFFD